MLRRLSEFLGALRLDEGRSFKGANEVMAVDGEPEVTGLSDVEGTSPALERPRGALTAPEGPARTGERMRVANDLTSASRGAPGDVVDTLHGDLDIGDVVDSGGERKAIQLARQAEDVCLPGWEELAVARLRRFGLIRDRPVRPDLGRLVQDLSLAPDDLDARTTCHEDLVVTSLEIEAAEHGRSCPGELGRLF